MNRINNDGSESHTGGWLLMRKYASEISEEDRKARNRMGRRSGLQGCRICGDSYTWKTAHSVMISKSSGVMVCCEECWEKGNKEEAKLAATQIVSSWPSDHDLLPRIHAAVDHESL